MKKILTALALIILLGYSNSNVQAIDYSIDNSIVDTVEIDSNTNTPFSSQLTQLQHPSLGTGAPPISFSSAKSIGARTTNHSIFYSFEYFFYSTNKKATTQL